MFFINHFNRGIWFPRSRANMTKPDESSQSHDKPCTLCGTPRSVLVRCQIDETGRWHFVCPGKCWISVSGGVEDAKGFKAEHPHYRYGGMVC